MNNKFTFKRDRHLAITPVFRLSFPALFKASAYRDPQTGTEGKPEFKATMLFENMDSLKTLPANLQGKGLPLMVAIQNAKLDFFGKDPKKWPKLDYPIFTKGEEHISKKSGEIFDGYAGKIIASAKTGEKYPPRINCANGEPADEQSIYAGCYCRAVVTVKPYYFARKNGVKLYLSQITKVRDGERFGGMEEIDFEEDAIEEGSFDGDSEDGEDADF